MVASCQMADDPVEHTGSNELIQSRPCIIPSLSSFCIHTSLQACLAHTTTCELILPSVHHEHALTPSLIKLLLIGDSGTSRHSSLRIPHSHVFRDSVARCCILSLVGCIRCFCMDATTTKSNSVGAHTQVSASHVCSSDSATTRGRRRSSLRSVLTCA